MSITKLTHLYGLVQAIGPWMAGQIVTRRFLGLTSPVEVTARRLPSRPRVVLRPCESDLFVASQTLGWLHYRLGRDVTERLRQIGKAWRARGVSPVIVDAGANVGYSSLFFADAYPDATIIAIEPDPDAFEILHRNTHNRANVRSVHAALWSHDRGVALRPDNHDSSWARQVAEHERKVDSEVDLTPSTTLDDVERLVADCRILILKLDIEGAEGEVCRASEATLRRTPCVIVEPHDFMAPGANCLGPLYAAIAGRPTDTLVEGENLVLIDSSARVGGSYVPGDTSMSS